MHCAFKAQWVLTAAPEGDFVKTFSQRSHRDKTLLVTSLYFLCGASVLVEPVQTHCDLRCQDAVRWKVVNVVFC